MNFQVVWSEDADNDLALIWLQSSDRRAVNVAELHASRLLSFDPYLYGNPLSEGLYVLHVPPLVV